MQWYPNTNGPATVFQYDPPCDMAEAPSVWYAYGDPGYGGKRIPEELYFDSTEKKVGAASVKLVSGRGFDVALNYRPSNDSISKWSLTAADTLYFWVRTIRNPVIGFQNFSIRIGDPKGNYYKYTASTSYLNNANLVWKNYKVPLSGGSGFTRSSVGTMSLDNVNYIEIHADTWDYGFTLWVDGVQFSPCSPFTGIADNKVTTDHSLQNYPNPFSGMTTISYELNSPGQVLLKVLDFTGREIQTLVNGFQNAGIYSIPFDSEDLSSGFYFLSLNNLDSRVMKKMMVVK